MPFNADISNITDGEPGTPAIANRPHTKLLENTNFLKAILDKLGTKGDILVHDGSNFQKIAIGSNNQTLTADSAEANGLKWSTATGLTWRSESSAYTAVNLDGIMVSTSGGAWTLTLPATPSKGDAVGIADQDQNFVTANLTIARNGSNIMGLAEDLTVNISNSNFILVYSGDATGGWIIT